jgi:DNA-binding response OmpR family regulator
MDMHMPEMDGLTATSAIRASGGKCQSVPIIAFTANAFAEDREACTKAGMTDFVAKPVRKKFLIQAVLRALWQNDGANRRDRAGADPAPIEPRPAARADASDAGVLDPAAFTSLAEEIDLEDAIAAFELFVTDTQRTLQSFAAMAVDPDRKRVQAGAHSLKSTAATFGFRKLWKLARQLEQDAPVMPGPEFRSIVPRFDEAFAQGRARFDEIFKPAA